jgi:hypothetical protein
VTALLRPPLACFGYFSPSFAPRGEKAKVPELIIYLAYDLAAYYGAGAYGATRVSTVVSGGEYALQNLERNAQTVRASSMLLGLPALDLQAAGGWGKGKTQKARALRQAGMMDKEKDARKAAELDSGRFWVSGTMGYSKNRSRPLGQSRIIASGR